MAIKFKRRYTLQQEVEETDKIGSVNSNFSVRNTIYRITVLYLLVSIVEMFWLKNIIADDFFRESMVEWGIQLNITSILMKILFGIAIVYLFFGLLIYKLGDYRKKIAWTMAIVTWIWIVVFCVVNRVFIFDLEIELDIPEIFLIPRFLAGLLFIAYMFFYLPYVVVVRANEIWQKEIEQGVDDI